jgi:hypothetical protein
MDMRQRHSTVIIGRNTVTKTSAPNLMRVEVEKTLRAHKIGKDSGLFRVPRVLDYDNSKGEAIFERLDSAPVSRAVPWGVGRIDLGKKLGVALAVIHRELVLSDNFRINLPDEFSLAHDEVFLHGDLSVNNVGIGGSKQHLTIFDWQMTPVYGGSATYGTSYFDILWFIDNLIHRPYTRFLYSNPVAPVASAFLEAYFNEAVISYDAERFSRYATRFFRIRVPHVRNDIVQNSKGRARLLFPRTQYILRTFIRSLTAPSSNS